MKPKNVRYHIKNCTRCGKRRRVYNVQAGGIYSLCCHECVQHDAKIWENAGRTGNPRIVGRGW